jgi:transposase
MGSSMTPGARERAFREKRRLRAAELFEQYVPNVVIAEALGVSDSAVDLWKAQWEEGGAEALRSSGRPGYPALLDEAQAGVLVTELDRGALAHGYEQDRWMLKWVNDLIGELFGVRFADTAGVWRFLRRIGYSHHRPGRRAMQRDERAIAEWREVTWPRITERARRTRAWIVCEDEAGAMLTPPIRGTFARRGRRVVLRCSYAYQRKVSMAAFACYRAGRLPKLFYALAPNASFTEDDFGPLLTDLHDKLADQDDAPGAELGAQLEQQRAEVVFGERGVRGERVVQPGKGPAPVAGEAGDREFAPVRGGDRQPHPFAALGPGGGAAGVEHGRRLVLKHDPCALWGSKTLCGP